MIKGANNSLMGLLNGESGRPISYGAIEERLIIAFQKF
jgi:hypothetical protein